MYNITYTLFNFCFSFRYHTIKSQKLLYLSEREAQRTKTEGVKKHSKNLDSIPIVEVVILFQNSTLLVITTYLLYKEQHYFTPSEINFTDQRIKISLHRKILFNPTYWKVFLTLHVKLFNSSFVH